MKQQLQRILGVSGLIALVLALLPQNALAALTLGATTLTTSGVLSIDGVAASAYTVGSSTTNGTITIGGTAQTGNITLGSSTAANSILIGSGSGATTIALATGNGSSKVGIGTSTVNNRLTVAGSADFSGNIALAGSSVATGRVINIDFSGALSTGTTGVYSKLNTTTAQDAYGGWFDVTTTGPGNNSAGLVATVMRVYDNSSGMGGATINAEGTNIGVTTGNGSSTNSDAIVEGAITHHGYTNTLYGGHFTINNQGNTPGAYPVYATLANTTASGTLTTGSLFHGSATNATSGSITNVRGLELTGWSNSATITNSYGIYMDTSIDVGATTKYAVYSSSTSQSYLQGNLGIGIAVPTAKLEVKDGHIASSQTTAPTQGVTGAGYSTGSMASGSTDTKGAITATVGAAVGTLVVNFNSVYTSAPVCTVSPASATAQVDQIKMYVTTGTGALTLNFVATPTGGSETWNYICVQ